MIYTRLSLSLLPGTFAICQLEPHAEIPPWALAGQFVSITRTADELSLVCQQERVPSKIRRDMGYRCLKVKGPLDLAMTGILASLATPLTEAGISVFAVSTFDTDYLLIKEAEVERAMEVLFTQGHEPSR